jgi:tetratricopeptide (TPR) repeat protein
VLRAADRAEVVAEAESATHWLRTAVQLGRALDLPPHERAELAIRYAEAWGHDPYELKIAALEEAIETVVTSGVELDDSRRARLDAYLGRYQYVAGLEADARRTLETALARRQGSAPTEGRALILHTLGWLCWRAGPLDEAPGILERSVAEARTAGSDFVERNAMHDLGVALSFQGRVSEAIPLLRESFRLAVETGDELLLTRSDVNLPAILDGNGEDWHESMAISLEGLERARRSVDRSSQSWIASNVADQLALLGRFDEALEYEHEALEAVRHVTEPVALSFRLFGLAWLRRLLGDPAGARAAEEEAEALGATLEPQAAGMAAARAALRRWADENAPEAAVEELARALEDLGGVGQVDASTMLARMALRVGRSESVGLAAHRFLHVTASQTGPRRLLERRWVGALADPAEAAVPAIEAAAAELDASGWRTLAAEAWADAALIAARAGMPSPALERAIAIGEEIGLHPPLGPLPETRWVVGGASTAAPGSGTSAEPAG